jgi:hypothetical protein
MKYTYKTNGVNESLPLLYRITIGSRLFYVGCADCASRPKKDYARNVARMLAGRPYRKNKPDGFRAIHKRLFEAVKNEEHISIELLRNVPADRKFEEEALEIAAHRAIYAERLLNGTGIRKKNEPNKAMVPTPVNVTVPANAGPAPFTSVAHL